jgi:predicted regulator of Ras-like GTPase activity (Roadblock/LC7/MglB family)
MTRFTIVRRDGATLKANLQGECTETVLGYVVAANVTSAAIKAAKRFNNDAYDVFVVEG